MDWHRINGIEIIDKPNYTKRPYLYELPVLRQDLSDYLSYPCDNKLAVSLALSDMGEYLRGINRTPTSPEYPELLAKRLPWFVKQLLERTDMVECGVSLKVGITNDIRDLVMPYLEACQFPMQIINWFDSREQECKWSSKFDAMRQRSLQFAQRIIHCDLSFLIGTHPAQRRIPLFAKILESWRDEQIASASRGVFHSRNSSPEVMRPRVHEIADTWGGIANEHPIWHQIESIYGESVNDAFNYWTQTSLFPHIPAGIVGCSRKFVDDADAQDKFYSLLAASTNDEVALMLYFHYENWEDSDIAMIHDAFPWHGYPHERDPYHVFRFCACQQDMPTDLFLSMHY